jgi:hypothetical protein
MADGAKLDVPLFELLSDLLQQVTLLRLSLSAVPISCQSTRFLLATHAGDARPVAAQTLAIRTPENHGMPLFWISIRGTDWMLRMGT